MLFSTEPKDSVKDLFDREKESAELRDKLKERMILVLGMRRIGKTSLVLSTLNSTDRNFVYVDVRKIYDEASRKVQAEKLYEELYFSLTKLSRKERVRDLLTKLNISLESPLKAKLPLDEIKGNIIKIFEQLNRIGKVVVAFDEAQYLRYSTVGLRSVLAHVYDHMKEVSLLFTGSEVGLLYDFVGVEDPESELYGRYFASVEIRPFEREKSREFLRAGFKEIGEKVEESVIERAVGEIDGVVGWLVYFGKLYPEKGVDALDEVKSLGSKMVKKELEGLFIRSPYYLDILKAIATMGRTRWKNVVNYVIVKNEKKVPNATISRDLKALMMTGFVEKIGEEYVIPDPIVKYTILQEY